MLGPNTPPEKIAEFDKAREGMPRPKTWTTMHTTLVEWLGARYVQDGYRFIPLVRRELSLICSIRVLFLRPDQPGDVLRSGDIDNRLKTLFDALRLPKNKDELGGYDAPGVDENPFFCLLEDDSLITDVSVETDLLLAPIRDQFSDNDARLVISVKLRPYDVNPGNVNFG
jgi:hypothetical protein